MRRLLLCSLLLLAAVVGAQNRSDTFGKSNAQIVAMGHDAWYKFYTSKTGESTADMVAVESLFGDALKARNDGLLRARPNSTGMYRKLRKLLGDYGQASIDAAYARTGGGTMWHPVYASIGAEVEDVLFGLLGGKVKTAPHLVVSNVKVALSILNTTFAQTHKQEGDNGWFKYGDAMRAVGSMRSRFSVLVPIAAHFDRVGSDRILKFCLDYAKTALSNG